MPNTLQPSHSPPVYICKEFCTLLFINAIFQNDCTQLYFHLHDKKSCGCTAFPTLPVARFQEFSFFQLNGYKTVSHCDLGLYSFDH